MKISDKWSESTMVVNTISALTAIKRFEIALFAE